MLSKRERNEEREREKDSRRFFLYFIRKRMKNEDNVKGGKARKGKSGFGCRYGDECMRERFFLIFKTRGFRLFSLSHSLEVPILLSFILSVNSLSFVFATIFSCSLCKV